MAKMEQLELCLRTRGGKRAGAGRRRSAPRARVPHAPRPPLRPEQPVQVTLRACADVPNLRERAPWAAIVRVLRAARERSDFRVIHHCVMSNHIHLICEADGDLELRSGMTALNTRLAMNLNRVFERSGPLLDHRFHARALGSPRAVRAALRYVLSNFRKHAAEQGTAVARGWVDPRSSGPVFDGWSDRRELAVGDYGVTAPRTWLLRVGWRRHGLLAVDDTPGACTKTPQRKAA